MKETQMNLRLTEQQSKVIDNIANKENTTKSELVIRSIKEHSDNVWGVKKLLDMMEIEGPIKLEEV